MMNTSASTFLLLCTLLFAPRLAEAQRLVDAPPKEARPPATASASKTTAFLHDAATEHVHPSAGGYAVLPLSEAGSHSLNLQAKVSNIGFANVTNVTLAVTVKNQLGQVVHSASSSTHPVLMPNDSVTLGAGQVILTQVDTYTIYYQSSIAEQDSDLVNNLDSVMLRVDSTHYARDMVSNGSLGIGAGNGGYMGSMFELTIGTNVLGIEVDLASHDANEPMAAVVFDMLGGVPNNIVARTDTLVFPNAMSGDILLPMQGGSTFLPPGQYVFCMIEFDSTLELSTAGQVFTPGTQWVDWPTSPTGAWANIEYFSFSYTFAIRPVVQADTCQFFNTPLDSLAHASCASPGIIEVGASGGTAPFTYAWSTGASTAAISAPAGGWYSVTVSEQGGCSRQHMFYLSGPQNPTGFDLAAYVNSPNFLLGFNTNIDFDVVNNGCTPVNGQAILVLDSALVYVGAVPAPASIQGDSLIWNLVGFNHDDPPFHATVTVYTPLTNSLGDILCMDAYVTPLLNDNVPFDNIRTGICRTVVGSYDPNDKHAFPVGECAEHYTVLDGHPLSYTIRFQNTGTAPAVNVHILDSLHPSLDPATFRWVTASHNMYTEMLPGNVLDFRFQDIMLPDSFSNEPASHGYVVFEVAPFGNTPSGTRIENTAHIYFDFNAAVVTNTPWNTLVDSIPACAPTVLTHAMPVRWEVFPNPAREKVRVRADRPIRQVMVVNTMGQMIRQVACSGNEATLHTLGIPGGTYFLRMLAEDGTVQVRVMIVE